MVFELPHDLEAETYEGICHIVANEAIAVMAEKCKNPWKEDKITKDTEPSAPAAATSSSVTRLVEYNEQGAPEALSKLLIENQGFVVGVRVQIKDGKEGAGTGHT